MSEQKRGEYLQTVKPGTWLFLGGVALLLVVFILWAFSNTMLDIQKNYAIATEDGIYGCVKLTRNESFRIRKDMQVVFPDTDDEGVILKIDQHVYTVGEMEEMFGAENAARLGMGDYNVLFDIQTDAQFEAGAVMPAWVILDEIKPIHLWFAER